MNYVERFIAWLDGGIRWFKGSADNDPSGASSKKLTGFWFCCVLAGYMVFKWCNWADAHNDWSLLPTVLGTVVGAGLVALGINMWEKVKGVATTKKDEI